MDFNKLNYETFRKLAQDESIDQYERVGFPAAFREDKSTDILMDIRSKLKNLDDHHKRFLDIGAGWSDLTEKLLSHCEQHNHMVTLVDSPEMLDLVPNYPFVQKIPAKFPLNLEAIAAYGPFDAILTYSVIQYPFVEGNIWDFMDSAVSLLAEEGQLLIGDIPNTSMRNRFLASHSALKYHQENYAHCGDSPPQPAFNQLERGAIDDGVLLGILMRLRAAGYHAFIMPQNKDLPMSNRREDLLVVRP